MFQLRKSQGKHCGDISFESGGGEKGEIQFQLNLTKLIYMVPGFVAILYCGYIMSFLTFDSQKQTPEKESN